MLCPAQHTHSLSHTLTLTYTRAGVMIYGGKGNMEWIVALYNPDQRPTPLATPIWAKRVAGGTGRDYPTTAVSVFCVLCWCCCRVAFTHSLTL